MRTARGIFAAAVLCATAIACVFPSLSSLDDGSEPTFVSDAAAPSSDSSFTEPLDGSTIALSDASADASAVYFADDWNTVDATSWSDAWALKGHVDFFKTPTIDGNTGKVGPKALLDGGGMPSLYVFARPSTLTPKDVVQRIRVRASSGGHRFGLFARLTGQNINGAGPDTTAYVLDCAPGCQLGRLVDSSYTVLKSIPGKGLSTSDLNIVFSVVSGDGSSTVVGGKVWPASDPEPADLTVVSDNEPSLTKGGSVALRFRSTVDYGMLTVDDYVVSPP